MVPENIPAMIYYIQGLPKKVRINHHIFSSIKKKNTDRHTNIE